MTEFRILIYLFQIFENMSAKATYDCPIPRPTDCSVIVLPDTKVADCPGVYGAFESEICDLWVTMAILDPDTGEYISTIPTDWTNPADYASATPNPGPTPPATQSIQHLAVIGDKPLPTFNDITVAKRWVIPTATTHQLNIDVTDFGFNDATTAPECQIPNYEFIRTLQLRPRVVLWFKTIDGLMVGGPNGILADVVSAGHVFGRGEGTILTGQIIFEWDKDCDPPCQPELSICDDPGIPPVVAAAAAKAPKSLKS